MRSLGLSGRLPSFQTWGGTVSPQRGGHRSPSLSSCLLPHRPVCCDVTLPAPAHMREVSLHWTSYPTPGSPRLPPPVSPASITSGFHGTPHTCSSDSNAENGKTRCSVHGGSAPRCRRRSGSDTLTVLRGFGRFPVDRHRSPGPLPCSSATRVSWPPPVIACHTGLPAPSRVHMPD